MLNGIKVGVVSLGCSKNRVDTEYMLGILKARGAVFVSDKTQADAILVNTCGFIASAKEESINTILEMAQLKKSGKLKALIVTGCLSERYRRELTDELPEVDVFLGVHNTAEVGEALENALSGRRTVSFKPSDKQIDCENRLLTTPPYQAYLKIAEGCSNRCSYCAIPQIRGPVKSRSIESLTAEAAMLARLGVKELILVAQDTTKYGVDLYGKNSLPELLRALRGVEGFKWIRVLYCYPENITNELLDAMLEDVRVCKYIDMPIQHIDDAVLSRMNRKSSRAQIYDKVALVRAASPDFILRTTLITGFPGETKEQFDGMCEALRELAFDRAGVFMYSQEDRTPAAAFPDQVPEEEKELRFRRLMSIQADVSRRKNEARVGKSYEVVQERYSRSAGGVICRSYAEAPEIDGKILLKGCEQAEPGRFCMAEIVRSFDYDLEGRLK